MKKLKWKRFLSCLLVVAMLFGTLSVGALAGEMPYASDIVHMSTETDEGDSQPDYELRVLTFEDADYKGDTNYAGGKNWSTLIDSPQYGGSLLYPTNAKAAYNWYDKGNTELAHIFGDEWGDHQYWGGGHAISHYASSDVKTYGGFDSQLTVYKAGVTGLVTAGGGHNNSDNFAVHYGYTDNSGYSGTVQQALYFADGEARVIDHMYINATTYLLNCCVNGNDLTASIGESDWIKLVATGYDADANKTGTSEIYMVNGPNNIMKDWTKWDLSGLGEVVQVEFNVTGSSDNGYGFSQPAYFAYDDVAVRFAKKAANNAPVVAEDAAAEAEAAVGTAWELDLSTIFSDADGDELTYTATVNDTEQTLTGSVLSYTPETAGDYTVVVTASDGKETASHTITLTAEEEAAISSILLNTYAETLVYNNESGNTLQLTATVQPAEATDWTIVWSSSNEAVATVDQNGLVTAVGEGDAVITAAIGDIKTECTVTVEKRNSAPTLIEGVTDLTVEIQTGLAYQLDDLINGKIFEDKDGDSLTYESYTYRKSSDGGETWGEWISIEMMEHGTLTSTLVNSVEGTYIYEFKANDGYEDSQDRWYLTLVVMDVVPADVNFYVGCDQNYSTHSTYPILELYKTAGIDENMFDYIGWFEKDGKTVYVYNPADYTIEDNADVDYVVINGEKYELHDYEKITFTNSAFDDSDDTATASGTLVGNYNMFYASIVTGRYSTRAYGWNAETEAYDVYLGGQSMELPMEKDIYGGGGGDIYLRVVSVYTTSQKTDGTNFTAEDYYAEMIMPVTGSMIHSGDPYIRNNRTYYPFLSYAAGNASLYNIYAYPYDTDNYIFNQSINNTTTAGYTVVDKQISIGTAQLLTVNVLQSADFDLYFQYNNFNTKAVEPEGEAVVNEDGTKTITYKVTKGNSNYTWRMTDTTGTYVTKAGWLESISAATEKTFTFAEGDAAEKASHDYSNLGTAVSTRDEGDIQVFLDHDGFMSTTDTYRVRAFRMWQLINSDTANIMIEPDFNVQVLQGNASDVTQVNGGNAVGNWLDVTPTGTDIIAVNYDSIDVYSTAGNYGTHGGLFPATNPERTGVFVITNEAAGTADANISFNGSKDTGRGDTWDYNYDTWYYLNTDTAPTLDFTVTGTGDMAVSYALVTTDNALNSTLSGWINVTADENGAYHADLLPMRSTGNGKGGTVIIKMTDATGTSYRLARVAEMTATVSNASNPGEPFMPGDQVSITFDGLYRAVNKVAGIFNPTTYYLRYTAGETEFNGSLGQYQQMDRASVKLTIPEDLPMGEDGTAVYTFTNGYIYGSMYSASSPFDTLYNMTDTGVGTNFSAVGVSFVLSRLADIPVTVEQKVYYDVKMNVTDGENTLTGYTLTLTDANGNAVEVGENGLYTLDYGKYNYTIALTGYVCNSGSFRLGSADADSVVDGVLTKDVVLTKAAENAWDGTTVSEPETDENGIYQIGTGAELAWFAKTVNAGSTGISGVLTADIELAGYAWTPIGNSSKKFAGSFDGQNHKVYNLYINYAGTTATTPYQGLFGYVQGSTSAYVEISNVSVQGAMSLTSTKSVTNGYSGGVIGYAQYANITNVHADVDITVTRVLGNWQFIGGVAGYINYATITNSSNAGTIKAWRYSAGVVAGAGNATVTGCLNTGEVTCASTCAAGIVAELRSNCTVSSCYNTGYIAAGGNYSGGIVGNYGTASTVKNCFNVGTVRDTTNMTQGSVIGNISSDSGVTEKLYYLDGTAAKGIGAVKDETTQFATAVSAETLASAGFVEMMNTGLEKAAFGKGTDHPILLWQSEESVIYGDINGDGMIDSSDASLIYRVINGDGELTEEQLQSADVNGDGEIDSMDAALIYRYANGNLSSFPVENN